MNRRILTIWCNVTDPVKAATEVGKNLLLLERDRPAGLARLRFGVGDAVDLDALRVKQRDQPALVGQRHRCNDVDDHGPAGAQHAGQLSTSSPCP